jgi:penicillin-binding protein 1A
MAQSPSVDRASNPAQPSDARAPDEHPKPRPAAAAPGSERPQVPAPPNAPGAWGRRLRVALKVVAIAVPALLLAASALVVIVVWRVEQNLPSIEELEKGYDPPQVTRVLARDGTLLANLFTERRTVIPFETVPDHTKLAFLAAEDAGFYQHEGLNYLGMLRALAANLRAGKTRQGGSTITQQVVKNVLLDPERTYERKIRETILARRLEQHLSKDRIFWLYLNHIYLGHGRYGIEEAARYYFGKKCRELDVAESALLAGIVAAPERFSPRHDPERALARRRYVLGQMLEKGFATPEVHDKAKDATLRLAPAAEAESELVPEAVAYVKRALEQVAGERAKRGGYSIRTTIDPTLQASARRALRRALDDYASRQKLAPPYHADSRRLWGKPFVGRPKANRIYVGTVVAVSDDDNAIDVRVGDITGRVLLTKEERYNPKRLPPSQFTKIGAALRVALLADAEPGGPTAPLRLELGPQGALVAVDVRTGRLLAIVGSYEAVMGGLDRASHARRQPGSSFKPFVYSYALHARLFTAANVLTLPLDPKVLPGVKEPISGETRRINLRTALAKSDNAAAVHLFNEAGPANVVQWTRALGILSNLEPTPSLALGAYEVTPLEMAASYTTFASGGTYRPLTVLTEMTGPDGRPLPLPALPPSRRVMQPEEAYLITSLLRSVIEDGTGRAARTLERPLAGKTGTTNEAKDAWFVGYSTDIVAAVWVGYDDALPLGRGESGGTTALPAFIHFMRDAHKNRVATDFPRPTSIIVASIDPATGLLAYVDQANAVEEEFLDGTAPSEMAERDAGPLDDAGPGDEPLGIMKNPEPARTEPDEAPEEGSLPAVLPPVEPPPF